MRYRDNRGRRLGQRPRAADPDTQSGIHDGKSGIVLQNAPLSRAPIVAPAQPAPMTELPSGSTMGSTAPMVVIPYIEVPGSAVPLKAPPQRQ